MPISIVMYTCLHYFSQMSFFIKFINIKVKTIQFLNRHTQFYQYFKIFLSSDAIHIINWNLRSIKWLSLINSLLTKICSLPGFVMLRSSLISFIVNDFRASMSRTVLIWFLRKFGLYSCSPIWCNQELRSFCKTTCTFINNEVDKENIL